MTADWPSAVEAPIARRHVDGHTVTIVVVCGFIGCDWSRAIGTAPLEVHQEYLDHLDVHDPDNIAAGLADCEATEPGTLYAGDTAERIAAEQARVDRFMHGGED